MANKIATYYEAYNKHIKTLSLTITEENNSKLCNASVAKQLGCVIEPYYNSAQLIPISALLSEPYYSLDFTLNATGYGSSEVDQFYIALFNENPSGKQLWFGYKTYKCIDIINRDNTHNISIYHDNRGILVNTISNNLNERFVRVTLYSSPVYLCKLMILSGSVRGYWEPITTDYFYIENKNLIFSYRV